MHIETSADARQSRRHAAGGGLAGPAAGDRGYLAAAASRFSLWWHGNRRPPALTADTAPGAGLQGGTAGEDPQPNGDAIPAPSADGYPRSEPDLAHLAGYGAKRGGIGAADSSHEHHWAGLCRQARQNMLNAVLLVVF